MRVNPGEVLKDFKGEVLKHPDETAVTLADMCIAALGMRTRKDLEEPWKRIVERDEMAKRIYLAEKNGQEIELTAAEIAMLQERVSLGNWTSFAIASAIRALEPGNAE